MDLQARYLVLHSAVVLLAGLLVGIPLARAIKRNASDSVVSQWRLAHDSLTVGPALTLALAAVLSSLSVGAPTKSWILWTWAAANYSFCASLPLGAAVGHRGRSFVKPVVNQIVFIGNMIGIVTSLAGAVIFLYAAYASLP